LPAGSGVSTARRWYRGRVAAIRALLAAGADRQAAGGDGRTAREVAEVEHKPLAVAALDA
jgi:hypothetical protein